MEITILHKDEKPLLKVTQIKARITYEGATPAKKLVVAAVAKALKVKEELIIVRKIDTAYGDQHALVLADVYADRKELELREHAAIIKKNTFTEKAEEKAEESAPAPSPEGDA